MDKECLGASFIRVLNTIYHNLGGMCNRFKCMGAYSHAGVCGYTVCKQKKSYSSGQTEDQQICKL